MRKRRSQAGALALRRPLPVLDRPNACWSLDFVHDQMTDGRRFRVLVIVDDCTRECLGLVPDTSISGKRRGSHHDHLDPPRPSGRSVIATGKHSAKSIPAHSRQGDRSTQATAGGIGTALTLDGVRVLDLQCLRRLLGWPHPPRQRCSRHIRSALPALLHPGAYRLLQRRLTVREMRSRGSFGHTGT